MKKSLTALFTALLFALSSGLAMAGQAPPTVTPSTPPTCTLSASPDTLARPGDSSTISWTTANASSFSIDHGIGSVTSVASGSLTVEPAFTTYYTGTATGAGGTVTCAVTIEVKAWNLIGDWSLLLEKGSVTDADGEGRIDDFPFSQITLPLNIQQGLLYEGGMHLYQGVLPGYHGSWVYMWFTPNVRPGHQKYVEISIGIPDTSFGDVVAGGYNVSCKLFLERTSESWGWGVMTAEHRESQDTLIPGAEEVPDRLFTSTCRAWRQTGDKG
ncbi:hypothetical protein EPN28_04910 [Patescibacteria group bacterium]|nr:MAG: hypothetical protein EPN28_04910 [Patescibacteria group bacterium]